LPEIGLIDVPTLEDKQFKPIFTHIKGQMEKFIKDWNADESNRDKTVHL